MSEEFDKYVHSNAVEWRNKQRRKFCEEGRPEEDRLSIETMDRMFPND